MDALDFLFSCCFILSITVVSFIFSQRRLWRLAEQFQGPPTRFLFGNILELQGNENHTFNILVKTIKEYGNILELQGNENHTFNILVKTIKEYGNILELQGNENHTFNILVKTIKEYGNILRIWIGYKLIIVLNDPADIQKVLGNAKIANRDKMVTKAIKPFVGDSLLTSRDEVWKVHRKIVTPIFHFNVLQSYVEVFGRKARVLCEKLEEFGDGRCVDVHKHVSMCTMAAICETAIGLSMDVRSGTGKDFYSGIVRASELVHNRAIRPYLMLDWLYPFTKDGMEAETTKKQIYGFTDKIIEMKLKEYFCTKSFDLSKKAKENTCNQKMKTLLEMLIESSENEGSAMSVSEIRDELTTIAAVGFDTSAISISNLFLLLGLNSNIQDDISRELDDIFGRDDRFATMEDLNRMFILDRAIKETLRLLPAIPIIAREISEDVVLSSGQRIPAGCSVVAFSYMVHRDPRYFPEPERFVPDRWLPDESGTARHPYAYLPFSAGPRNCIGQKYAMLQMKSIASSVLRRFTIRHRFNEKDMQCLGLSSSLRFSKLYEIQLTKK